MSIKALIRRDLRKERIAELEAQRVRGEITPQDFQKQVSGLEPKSVWYLNPAKPFVKPAWFLPNNATALPATPYQVTLAAGGTSGVIPVEFDEGTGHGEIFALVSEHTGAYEVTITDQGRKYQLMDRPIHADTICGSAAQPFILPLTYFVSVREGTRQLSLNFTDLSGAPNDIRFAMLGRRWLHREAPADVLETFHQRFAQLDRSLLYFTTTKDPLAAVAPGGAGTEFQVIAPSDAPLELMKLTAVTDPAGTPFEIELNEYGSGRSFSGDRLRVHSNLMFGTPNFPSIPFESFFLPRNFRLIGRIYNLGLGAADFYLTWTGAKILRPDQ